MLSVLDITGWVNGKLCKFMPEVKTYGIAKSAVKGDGIAPYTEEKYIGIDDTFKAQAYHKQLTISSTTVPLSGYGDNEQSLQNSYSMALIVFFNEEKCGFSADKLYTFIQTSITGRLKGQGYKSVRVSVVNAILSDAQVWAQEYGQTPYKLAGPQRLIQVNYNIVMVYNPECIAIPQC